MNVIAAVDNNFGIGISGSLLIRIPEDTKFFTITTLNKIVIMGHSTFKSLPGSRALKNRTNIILSKEKGLSYPDAIICGSLGDLCRKVKSFDTGDIFVIGGQAVYELLLPYCEYAFITKINAAFKADRFFPDIDKMREWVCIEESEEIWGEEIKARLYKYKNTDCRDISKLCEQGTDK